MDHRPIGVFDSGYGGISVLAAAVSLMPKERFVYLGDNLRAPYGALPQADIMANTRNGIRFLINEGCKAIVIACNTATSVAAAALRGEMELPIIAMEPALKPASMVEGDGRVLVLATEVTLKLDKFKRLMDSYGRDAVPIPAPKLVEAVEAGLLEGEDVTTLFTEYLSPYLCHPVKAVVLGCTHFVFLQNALRSFLPAQILLIDGNAGTARQLQKRLTQAQLLNDMEFSDLSERVTFHSTRQDDETLTRMHTLFYFALSQLCDR